MDTVFLQGLRFSATLGVNAWEQALPQQLEVDVELDFDLRPAARSDAVVDTLDYAQIAERLQQWIHANPVQLLETLAERLAEQLFATFPVERVALRLVKPAIIQAQAKVGIRIERIRR